MHLSRKGIFGLLELERQVTTNLNGNQTSQNSINACQHVGRERCRFDPRMIQYAVS